MLLKNLPFYVQDGDKNDWPGQIGFNGDRGDHL